MILVTGAAGLLGRKLVSGLLKEGKSVRGLVYNSKPEIPGQQNFSGNLEWVKGDVLDLESLETALEGVTEVYHCAGFVSFKQGTASKMISVNTEGTANVVNACLVKGIRKLLHVSSIASLGRNMDGGFLNEETQWEHSPENTPYAISKFGGEREVWRGMAEGLNAVIVNPGVILGPGGWDRSSGQLFKTIWQGMPFYPLGISGYIDARDVADIMIRLMKHPVSGERFVAVGGNYAYKELFTLIAKAMGKNPPSIPVGRMLGSIGWKLSETHSFLTGKPHLLSRSSARLAQGKFRYSSEKIQKLLDFKFRPIEETINETVDIFMREKLKLSNSPFQPGLQVSG